MIDEKLYFLCKKYGEIAVRYRNKFAGLLPEVYKRRLFEKKGYSSIFEFAAKLGGMSQEHVRRVLNLEERFKSIPVLREILVSGEVSVSKLAKVASIATLQNQQELARQVRLLPRSALETLVRDEKMFRLENRAGGYQNGLSEPQTKENSVPGNTHLQQNFESAIVRDGGGAKWNMTAGVAAGSSLEGLRLAPEVRQKLFELQEKGIDINELLLAFLEKRELEIAKEKEALAAEYENACETDDLPVSRHIPARMRKILQKEHGTKCSIRHCGKSAQTIHHTQRFSLSQNHNPQFLAPLCNEHHLIAHSIDMKFHNKRL